MPPTLAECIRATTVAGNLAIGCWLLFGFGVTTLLLVLDRFVGVCRDTPGQERPNCRINFRQSVETGWTFAFSDFLGESGPPYSVRLQCRPAELGQLDIDCRSLAISAVFQRVGYGLTFGETDQA